MEKRGLAKSLTARSVGPIGQIERLPPPASKLVLRKQMDTNAHWAFFGGESRINSVLAGRIDQKNRLITLLIE